MAPQTTTQTQPASQASGVDPKHYKYRILVFRNGAPISDKDLGTLIKAEVNVGLYKTGRFTLEYSNSAGPGGDDQTPLPYTSVYTGAKHFKPREKWDICFQASTNEMPPFVPSYEGNTICGYAVRIESDFNKQAQGPVKITGYDKLYLFHEGIHNRTFLNMEHSEIVRKIAGDVGISNVEIESTGFVDKYVCECDETNIEFIRKLAALNGFEFFVQGDDEGNDKLYFRRPQPMGEPISLKWGENVRKIDVRYRQLPIDYVQVPYWDYEKKKGEQVRKPRNAGIAITRAPRCPESPPATNKTATIKTPGSWHTHTPEKAQAVAQSLCNEFKGQYLCADVEVEGNPDIRPGCWVKLPEDQKGDLGIFTGDYYVTEVTHTYHNGNLTTRFTVSETGGYSLLQHNLSNEHRLKPGQTNLVGIVTDNKDPDNMGRVKVKFPTLEERESYWARMVMPGAGKGRGFDCLPEINDEVMVAFEHGDIHRPYIVGGVWNGKDEPPEHIDDSVQNGKVRLRTFKTRVGHEMQFVDENSSKRNKGIYLKTAGEHKFEMDDKEKRILIETAKGLKIEMDDKQKAIVIEVPGGGNIRLDMTGVSINGF